MSYVRRQNNWRLDSWFISELDTRHVEQYNHRADHSRPLSHYFFSQHNLRYHQYCWVPPGASWHTLPQYDFPATSKHLHIYWFLFFLLLEFNLPSEAKSVNPIQYWRLFARRSSTWASSCEEKNSARWPPFSQQNWESLIIIMNSFIFDLIKR